MTANVTCPAPYRVQVNDTCKWSCGAGTTPDLSNNRTCKCKPGYVAVGTDAHGRRVCRPCTGVYRKIDVDAAGIKRCVWNCGSDSNTVPPVGTSDDASVIHDVAQAVCICKGDFIFDKYDEFQRRVCKPRNATCPYPKVLVDGVCKLVCGAGTEASADGSKCECKDGHVPISSGSSGLVCAECKSPYHVIVSSDVSNTPRCVW